jgi:uncharacterized protein
MEIKRLEQFNSWWFENKVNPDLALDFKRDLYYELEDVISNKFILAIVGLRRTGKTTILYQLIQYLLNQNINSKNILFFSFDESIKDLFDVLETYKELNNINFSKDKVYLFLDEIQKCNDWENQIKKYYDLYPKLKIIISGSESLFIRKKNKETLAGRVFEYFLQGLSFKEYLSLRGIKKENFNYKTIISPLLKEYIENGSFPETINLSEKLYKEYIRSLVIDKIVYKDIPNSYKIADPSFLSLLLELISKNPGIYIDYQSIAKQFNKDRRVVKDYLIYLEHSFLIRIISNYRKGSSSLRKMKRAYPSDNSLIKLFKFNYEEDFYGKLVENVCVNFLQAQCFWKNSFEVDIILNEKPIEIKYRNEIRKSDIKGVKEFMKKFNVNEGIIITKNHDEILEFDNFKINFISLWKFLLGI